MFKIISSLFILMILQVQVTFPQVLSRSPLFNLLQRPVQEAILEAPRNYAPQSYNSQILETVSNPPITQPYNPQILETIPNIPIAPAPPTPPVPSTTIITDCSPSVCKNLANTLQLMIVCNLLQNTQGGSDLAVQLAAPIINEVISSPNFSCGCPNPLYPNAVSPNLPTIASSLASPSKVIPQNAYSNVLTPNYTNLVGIPNGLFYNVS